MPNRMVRIEVCPEGVGILDFQSRYPRAHSFWQADDRSNSASHCAQREATDAGHPHGAVQPIRCFTELEVEIAAALCQTCSVVAFGQLGVVDAENCSDGTGLGNLRK
jgi:hypothetical protein